MLDTAFDAILAWCDEEGKDKFRGLIVKYLSGDWKVAVSDINRKHSK